MYKYAPPYHLNWYLVKKRRKQLARQAYILQSIFLGSLHFALLKNVWEATKTTLPSFVSQKIVKNHFFIYTYASSLILQMETITAKSISTVAVMMAKEAIPTWLGLLFHVSGNWNIEGDDGTSSRIKQQKINDAILNTQLSFLCLQSWWHNFLHNRYTWTSTTHWAIFPIKWIGYLNHF